MRWLYATANTDDDDDDDCDGDDDVSDETTQIAKNRDNVLLHLILHHTASLSIHSFIHSFIRTGGWNPLYAYQKFEQPLH